MQEPLLPLFPLGLVLLPGAPLPLHIFEDRYKEMIGEAIRTKTEFGVVQAGDQGILNIGCTATVDEVVNRHADGRLDILTTGRRRFEIILLDQRKPFLRASVSFFDDDEAELPSLNARAMALAGFQLLVKTGEVHAEIPEHTDPHLSFRIAQHVDDVDLRQTLLAMRSEGERLRQISEFLPDYIAKLRRVSHVRRVAPMNGHARTSIDESGPE